MERINYNVRESHEGQALNFPYYHRQIDYINQIILFVYNIVSLIMKSLFQRFTTMLQHMNSKLYQTTHRIGKQVTGIINSYYELFCTIIRQNAILPIVNRLINIFIHEIALKSQIISEMYKFNSLSSHYYIRHIIKKCTPLNLDTHKQKLQELNAIICAEHVRIYVYCVLCEIKVYILTILATIERLCSVTSIILEILRILCKLFIILSETLWFVAFIMKFICQYLYLFTTTLITFNKLITKLSNRALNETVYSRK
ncbi:unnamed protein product [Heterobilharzia americana]|nr:unnamed protein product [Heterobilharzia americana]